MRREREGLASEAVTLCILSPRPLERLEDEDGVA